MKINPYEVKTKENLIEFLISLRSDFKINEKDWENPTLDMFLEGMEAWLTDTESWTDASIWGTFAIILSAGKSYE
ncbi:glycyl-tRNA synthetase alpha subunit [Paenibacillus sp. V4I3]|uniref:DUF7660 family protein n=1 Tax=Paenibacillus sp. V4I3 TaxID=3042305 RepID=UPI002783ADC5|nr:hypothetical protein [Paenibacillus sp. V4I3]MDQ0876123.1 glycyl-tRNA synthetase alpha subunit [Paenibacillus sp. V4I3]